MNSPSKHTLHESPSLRPLEGNNHHDSAMALFEKYAKLNTSIEATRTKQQRVLQQTSLIEQQIQEAEQLNEEITLKIHKAKQATIDCKERQSKLQTEVIQAKQEREEALWQLDRVKNQQQRLEMHALESHQMFLDSCKEFRKSSKRLRDRQEIFQSTSKIKEEESKILTAQKELDKLREQEAKAREVVLSLKKKCEVASAKREERKNRLDQGSHQLSRLRQDCCKLQKEIDAAQVEIAEQEALIQTFESEIAKKKLAAKYSQNRKDSVIPAVSSVRKKDRDFSRFSAEKQKRSITPLSSSGSKIVGANQALSRSTPLNHTPPNSSPNIFSQHEQHPHRIGRVRYNHQFRTELEIMSQANAKTSDGGESGSFFAHDGHPSDEEGDDANDDDNLLQFEAFSGKSSI